jgi:hypothetical protein
VSELRAPDPTLDALDADVNLYMSGWDARPLVAHLPGCLSMDLAWMEEAQDARYIAVPCRECFPDAPPRGVDPLNRPNAGRYLSWQVQP